MKTLFIILPWLVAQLLRGVEGAVDHQVLVTVHSLLLRESRCAECYNSPNPILRDKCCDGNSNSSSCPDSCDLLLRFCQLTDLQELPDLPADALIGSQCGGQSTLLSHAEGLFENNFKAGVTRHFNETGPFGRALGALHNPVTYNEPGRWKGAQLNISVVDRDPVPGDTEDLIDHFAIPINISVGSSMRKDLTGIYNYVKLELTIEVRCIANNTDGNCSCLPGFSGQSCEVNIDDCAGVTCSGRGVCVDGVQSFSCNCDPGYTGALCESGEAPLPAIIGGAVGGVLLLVVLVILTSLLVLLVFKQQRQNRTKTIDVQTQGTAYDNFNSSRVLLESGDIHVYEEAAEDQAGRSGSETLNKFNNALYGVDHETKKLEHEYESTDQVHSSSRDNSDQYQEFERKFENPIYGGEDDEIVNNTEHEFKNPIYGDEDNGGYLNDPIPAHERDIDYNQVGNVYHTLESNWERQQRYAETGQAETPASVAVTSLAQGQTGTPNHSYEDMT